MSILFVSSFALFRGTRFGGSKRLYYLAKEMQRLGDLRLICLDGAGELDGRDPPDGIPGALYLHGIPAAHPKGGFRLPFDMGKELVGRREEIVRFLGGRTFDGLFLAYPQSLGFLELGLQDRCRKVVYSDDDLVLEKYRKAVAKASGLWRLIGRRLRYRQALRYMGRKFRQTTSLVAISPEEASILESHFPDKPVHVLRYGLDLEEYPLQPPPADPLTLGYIGNYHHGPNQDALEYFLDQLLPYLRAQEPALKAVVAGKGIPAALRSRHEGQGHVVYLENVEHLEEFYGTIGIFVNPIVSGRGMRTKLIECAAFGRPIVSTPLGAEGTEGLQVTRASDGPGFLSAIRALASVQYYRDMVAGNRAAVEREYSIGSVFQQVRGLLQ